MTEDKDKRLKVKGANLKIFEAVMERNFTLKIGKSKRFVVHPPSLKFRWAGASRLKDRGRKSDEDGKMDAESSELNSIHIFPRTNLLNFLIC
jgi:hypothetical protein